MSMHHLPYEVITLVAGDLDPTDIYNLSACSRRFRPLAYDQTVCRKALQVVFGLRFPRGCLSADDTLLLM